MRGWDANAVIRHVIGGNQWVLMVAGLEVPELAEGMVEAHAASAAAAHEVFAAEDGLTRGYELPFAELPGTAFAFLRSADVSRTPGTWPGPPASRPTSTPSWPPPTSTRPGC